MKTVLNDLKWDNLNMAAHPALEDYDNPPYKAYIESALVQCYDTSVTLYNMRGQLVTRKDLSHMIAGKHTCVLPSEVVPAAGSYLILMETESETMVSKLIRQ